MYGGDRVLVPTSALIALAVRGRSIFPISVALLFLDVFYIIYMELCFNIQLFRGDRARHRV